MYADLRRESAERTVELDFPSYAIGGLSVGEPREKTVEMIAAALEVLPKDKPRLRDGCGVSARDRPVCRDGRGHDGLCTATRAGRHGLLFTSEGRMNIKNARLCPRTRARPIPSAHARSCVRYSRAYLRHLFVAAEPLAAMLNTIHNLSFYLDTMRAVRHAIYRLGDLSGCFQQVRRWSERP